MDAADQRLAAADSDYPSSSSPPAVDVTTLSPLIQPGMGLPFELWDYIVSFLGLEPYPLLACCLTCQSFHTHARGRLDRLAYRELPLDDYTHIDHFVDEIRTVPGVARSIRNLTLARQPPLAFSLVPHRLATQLVNLRRLELSDTSEIPNVRSSTWSLYGRAFPSVVELGLSTVHFPSFMDFVRFVASFRTLQTLELSSVSCPHPGVHPTRLRSSNTLNHLEELAIRRMGKDSAYFLGQVIYWLSSRASAVQKLHIDDTLPSHPLGFLLAQAIQTHILVFTIFFDDPSPTKESRRSWRRFTNAFSSGVPVLRELTLFGMEVQHIPFARALIAHTIRLTPSLKDLTILGYPEQSADIEPWHLIDTILFALHRRSQIRIDAVTNLNMGILLPLMSLV